MSHHLQYSLNVYSATGEMTCKVEEETSPGFYLFSRTLFETFYSEVHCLKHFIVKSIDIFLVLPAQRTHKLFHECYGILIQIHCVTKPVKHSYVSTAFCDSFSTNLFRLAKD